jgi:glycosyltransferase involved in cell wall biosynthesis
MPATNPLVSVVVPCFNAKATVKQTLDSIAMQKTDFEVQVLIGDDCSTDGTQDLLRSIQGNYPDGFEFLLRPQNMGERGNKNCQDLLHRCRGKYMAILEADDFWTYDGKLQAQVDFLESHPDYVACYHHVTVVGADSKPNGEKYPECPKEEYDWNEFFLCSLPGQTGTSVYRREEFAHARDAFTSMQQYDFYAADRRNAFCLLTCGRIKCMPQTWGAYRHVKKGGSSYSANVRIDEDYARNEILFGRTCVMFAQSLGNPDAIEAAKLQYYRTYLKWTRRLPNATTFSRADCMSELRGEKNRLRYRLCFIRWYATLGFRSLRGKGVTL